MSILEYDYPTIWVIKTRLWILKTNATRTLDVERIELFG